MTDRVTIDGVDIRAEYGARLAYGSYKSIVQWPALKEVSGNDWQEEDGFEPDLSSPRLASRSVSIRFILDGDAGDILRFYSFLGGRPTRSYTFVGIGRTLTMRLVSMQSLRYAQHFHLLNIQLSADIPLEGYTYADPSSALPADGSYALDGVPLSAYGVRILEGTRESAAGQPDVKPLLLRSPQGVEGSEYDENPILNNPSGSGYVTVGHEYEGVAGTWKQSTSRGTVTYTGRGMKLRCLLKAASPAAAWRNYDALLYNLTKTADTDDPTLAGARTLVIAEPAATYRCYYKEQEVEDFFCGDGIVWILFSMTLELFDMVV